MLLAPYTWQDLISDKLIQNHSYSPANHKPIDLITNVRRVCEVPVDFLAIIFNSTTWFLWQRRSACCFHKLVPVEATIIIHHVTNYVILDRCKRFWELSVSKRCLSILNPYKSRPIVTVVQFAPIKKVFYSYPVPANLDSSRACINVLVPMAKTTKTEKGNLLRTSEIFSMVAL